MDSIVIAIIIGAIIIAYAVGSLKSDNSDDGDYTPYYHDSKGSAIEDGLKKGLKPEEIFEEKKNYFKSVEDVSAYISKLGLEDKFKELDKLREENPNLILELSFEEAVQDVQKLKGEIEEHEEDFILAKETHNYDQAKTDQDLIKYSKRRLMYSEGLLRELKQELTSRKSKTPKRTKIITQS